MGTNHYPFRGSQAVMVFFHCLQANPLLTFSLEIASGEIRHIIYSNGYLLVICAHICPLFSFNITKLV